MSVFIEKIIKTGSKLDFCFTLKFKTFTFRTHLTGVCGNKIMTQATTELYFNFTTMHALQRLTAVKFYLFI